MPRVFVFSLEDLGTSYRLLRHIKSFASLPNSYVYAVAPCASVLPKEIEDLPNLQIHNFIDFLKNKSFLTLLFLPVFAALNFIQICVMISKVGKIDFLLIQSQPLFFSYLFGIIVRMIKKCKLIVDIKPFHIDMKTHSNSSLETTLPKFADIRIVPSRSMQGYLQLKGIRSEIIRDNPGTMFKPTMELRQNIYSLLNVESNTGLIGIPFPYSDDQALDMLLQIIQKTDQLGKTMAFIIFGGGKSQTSIESKLKRLQLKNVKYFVFPLLADVYPQIIGACDLGISLFGARNILDLPSELIEMEYSCVPIATFLFGCVREAVSESTGFFFKNEDELIDIIKRVFVSKTVDIGLMRENSKKQLTKWEDSWIEAFSKYFVEEDE